MAERSGDADGYRSTVAGILASVPKHADSPLSIDEIAQRAAGSAWPPAPELRAMVAALVVALDAFGVVSSLGGRYKLRGPIPAHFLSSLIWYVTSGRPILDNWLRAGVRDELPREQLLDHAVHFLKLLEDKRLRLGGPGAQPRRRQQVAFTFVKTRQDGRSYFLFEWDRPAEQYQLIGGHVENGDDPETAALHEFLEEMHIANEQSLHPGRDFELLTDLSWAEASPVTWVRVSPTVGALTEYELHFFRARIGVRQLRLAEHHRWLTIDEMLAGRTESGRRTGDPAMFRLLDTRLRGGLEGVPVSLDAAAVRDFRAHVETGSSAPVFIGHGHSPVWRELADHLRDRHGYRVVAFESAPRMGRSISDILVEMTSQASFAILIHTAEDEQADGRLRARQNVIHETGLFQGCLGFDRAIVVREYGCEDFSNLSGLQEVHYRTDIREVFGDVVAALRRAGATDR